jgi:hypothetical protein
MSIEDAHALKVTEDRAIVVDGYYELPLLWKVENPTLPQNREMALKRLNHLKRRLDNDKDLHEKYDEKIKEHQRKGYAKKLSPGEASGTTPKNLVPTSLSRLSSRQAKQSSYSVRHRCQIPWNFAQ